MYHARELDSLRVGDYDALYDLKRVVEKRREEAELRRWWRTGLGPEYSLNYFEEDEDLARGGGDAFPGQEYVR
jgi:hypothetical protein